MCQIRPTKSAARVIYQTNTNPVEYHVISYATTVGTYQQTISTCFKHSADLTKRVMSFNLLI